jgi:hypothetical protein
MESQWTPKTSETDLRGQNSIACGVLYIIEKLLERRCLKWARIAHLDIWTQVMAKRRAGSQIVSLTPDHKMSGIDPIYLVADDVPHTVKKLSTITTTLLQTALRSEVCSQSYAASKSRESRLAGFRDSHAGVARESRERKTIWMWAPWRGPEYTIRGKVVASPKSGPW